MLKPTKTPLCEYKTKIRGEGWRDKGKVFVPKRNACLRCESGRERERDRIEKGKRTLMIGKEETWVRKGHAH